jgi:hypothetical protein
MPTEDTVVIPLDRRKMLPFALGSAAFVALGALLIATSGGESFLDAWTMRLAGAASVAFFGLILVTVVPKMLDSRPGLVIGEEGILDNSSALSAGMIPWTEITGIKITSVKAQDFLTILLANPDRFVERGGPIRRFARLANQRFYGSPVHISAKTLAIGFDELVALVEGRREAWAGKSTHPDP